MREEPMIRRLYTAVIIVLALAAHALGAQPGDDGATINIMRPEPATPAAKHRHAHKPRSGREAGEPKGFGIKEDTRRGSAGAVFPAPLPPPQHFNSPPAKTFVTQPPDVPPPLYVPQTGRVLPNLPSVSGSGSNGAETSQDRAFRCAHQAGVYGSAAGDRSAYIGSCVNQ
jgi:hypothetical protein